MRKLMSLTLVTIFTISFLATSSFAANNGYVELTGLDTNASYYLVTVSTRDGVVPPNRLVTPDSRGNVVITNLVPGTEYKFVGKAYDGDDNHFGGFVKKAIAIEDTDW